MTPKEFELALVEAAEEFGALRYDPNTCPPPRKHDGQEHRLQGRLSPRRTMAAQSCMA